MSPLSLLPCPVQLSYCIDPKTAGQHRSLFWVTSCVWDKKIGHMSHSMYELYDPMSLPFNLPGTLTLLKHHINFISTFPGVAFSSQGSSRPAKRSQVAHRVSTHLANDATEHPWMSPFLQTINLESWGRTMNLQKKAWNSWNMSDLFQAADETWPKVFNEGWKTWKFQSMTPEFLWHNAAQSHPAQLLWLQYSLDFFVEWCKGVKAKRAKNVSTSESSNLEDLLMALTKKYLIHGTTRQFNSLETEASFSTTYLSHPGLWIAMQLHQCWSKRDLTSHQNFPRQLFGETWTNPVMTLPIRIRVCTLMLMLKRCCTATDACDGWFKQCWNFILPNIEMLSST